MRPFFTTVFGGLAAIVIGVGIAWGSVTAWRAFVPTVSDSIAQALQAPARAVKAISAAPGSTEGTVVSGLTRIVRYTANQEEDLIDQAAQTLPSGADGRITASAYLVKDLTTGAELVEHDQDRRVPIASLTKLVTAAVARRLIPPNAKIPITKEVMATYGNTADFRIGETLSAADLLYPLLMVSSNDAAEAYARYYGRAAFLKAMNDFAQSIGAYSMYFADPSGLSPQNEATANDLAIVLDWLRANDPEILSVTTLRTKTIHGHTWYNPTHFLSWSYYIGGKNGYTDEADRTAASLFQLGPLKHIYAVIVLGSDNRDADVIRLVGKVDK